MNWCLNLAALDLVIDLIGSGLNSYSGSDNSTAQDRICRRIGKKRMIIHKKSYITHVIGVLQIL